MDREYLLRKLRQAREVREHKSNDAAKYEAYARTKPGDAGVQERLRNLQNGYVTAADTVAELEDELGRHEMLVRASENPSNLEAGASFSAPSRPVHPAGVEAPVRQRAVFDEAQRVLQDHLRCGEMASSDADRIDGVLRGGDLHFGVDARYVAAVGQREYATAFMKMLQYGDGAVMRMTNEERDSVQQVFAAEKLRTMSTGVLAAGGYGLPISIDPTMIVSNPGTISPIRTLASVVSISTREYRAVTTAGVVSTFADELTEVADGSPTLAQPDIITERAQAFVPFSIELGQDYPNLEQDLLNLFSDAKNILEGTKFALGAGHSSHEPQGLVTGLTGSSIFTTAAAGAWAIADVYAVQNNLSPRWQANAKWLMSLPTYNATRRLVASGSTAEPQIISPDGSLLLTKPWFETSDLAGIAASAKIAVYGDVNNAFRIADRIGMSVELVPHLFGSSRLPVGARGLYSFWRTSSAVIVNDAARVIQVHA